jgi:tetrahydromethanopterin S-methyltransferase subunit A
MNPVQAGELARAELQAGIALTKCQQCGCMRETLETLRASTSTADPDMRELAIQAATWVDQMAPVRYACLGCAHCYPAVALNALTESGLVDAAGVVCALEETKRESQNCRRQYCLPASSDAASVVAGYFVILFNKPWPAVADDYAVLCNGQDCPVAVSTLASGQLVDDLARLEPPGLCIVGKTETENIGVDKVVKNVLANPTIRYLIVAGRDPDGHRSGQTLVALSSNGVDDRMRVVGSIGKRPILRNVTHDEVEAFRNQVHVIDLIGCEDAQEIVANIEELSAAVRTTPSDTCTCGGGCSATPRLLGPEVILAPPAERVEMDPAGYFVVIPDSKRQVITVEHYGYDNQLQHVVEGSTSRDLYSTIIGAGWVSQLSHAAYLGRELTKAELSLRHGLVYMQDSD